MDGPEHPYAWVVYLQVGAAGSMAAVGAINAMWWWRDRSQRSSASTALLCVSVAVTLLVGAGGLSFPAADVLRVVVPVRAVFIGVTAVLFLVTLGTLVPLPALRYAIAAEVVLAGSYVGLGVTDTGAYSFSDDSPWPRIQPFGHVLVLASVLLFLWYAGRTWVDLRGPRRRQLGSAVGCVLAVLTVPAVTGPGAWTEAMTSLWTLPIAVLLAVWCSTRVLDLQFSLRSAEAGWREAERAARYHARHDELTGLPNRGGAVETLQAMLMTAGAGTPVVITEIRVGELDGVSAAADPQAGDRVLRAIAGQLNTVLPPDAVVARVGDHTFMVIDVASAGSSIDEFEESAERAVALLRRSADMPRGLVVSVGIAVSHPGSTAPRLMQEVGIALLAAQHVRSRVRAYRPELRKQLIDRSRISRLLTVAVDQDELELHYQPVRETTSLRRVGVEALVRWRHHGRLHPPAEWIPVAEEQGLMPVIGLQVLRLAARDQPTLGCPIAVNVSACQLADPGFAAEVLDVLRDVPREAVILEITESAVMADLAQAQAALSLLRGHGIRIAIDDFGTEYSSLSRLATVPFDILKIDRSFVSEVLTPTGRAIVAAIHALAVSLGKTTVAEGVETCEQLQALTDIGCDRVQGFLTGRPVPLARSVTGSAPAEDAPPTLPDLDAVVVAPSTDVRHPFWDGRGPT